MSPIKRCGVNQSLTRSGLSPEARFPLETRSSTLSLGLSTARLIRARFNVQLNKELTGAGIRWPVRLVCVCI